MNKEYQRKTTRLQSKEKHKHRQGDFWYLRKCQGACQVQVYCALLKLIQYEMVKIRYALDMLSASMRWLTK